MRIIQIWITKVSKKMSVQVPNSSTRAIDRWCRSLLIAKLEKLEVGEIQLIDSNGSHSFGCPDKTNPLTVTLNVTDQRFYSDIAFGGTVAAGEAYIQGYWSSSNLTDLIRIMIGNRHILNQMEGNLSLLKNAFLRVAHWLNRNSQAGSRRNIEAHYDLGNEMFELFLDPTMMYSCAYYPDEKTSLEQASLAKLKRICDKLQLNESDHVIEIGTGWGGFALYAAENYGCKVTTTTISQQQHDWAKQRIIEAGLEDKITLLMEDYRDLQGTYDKLVSIEMIEAVGHQFLDTYFAKCSSLLKPEGIMLIQSITIADQQYDRAIKSVDFIQRFIFPGGLIPYVSAITRSVNS